MKSLLPLFSLLALTAGRRHLCADLTLPICTKNICNPICFPFSYPAVYKDVWRNEGQGASKHIDARHGCIHGGVLSCKDGSSPQRVFNVCPNDQKQCPHGYGQHGGSKPFDACPWPHVQPLCPSGKPYTCTFSHKRCKSPHHINPPHYTKPRKQCKKGRPHCPWFTRNRNNEWNPDPSGPFNQGTVRPQNKVNGNGRPALSPFHTQRPCGGSPASSGNPGACPCDNVHLFEANTTSEDWRPSWEECGRSCWNEYDPSTGHQICNFWEWHKKGPNGPNNYGGPGPNGPDGLCKRASNYRKSVKRTPKDYHVISGSYKCGITKDKILDKITEGNIGNIICTEACELAYELCPLPSSICKIALAVCLDLCS